MRDFSTKHLPREFKTRINNTFGESGKAWLAELPEILRECESNWNMRLIKSFDQPAFNCIVFAQLSSGREVVLKAGVPNHEFRSEIEALRHYDGLGSVKLLKANTEKGLMLLERLQPGQPLREIDEKKACLIATEVMQKLWKKPPEKHELLSIHDWGKGFQKLRHEFEGGSGPFPADVVDRAEKTFAELANSMSEEVVLHGDLHHWNILSSGTDWLAIDPKGIIGEPAYEVGAWLRNPIDTINDDPNIKKIQNYRLDVFSERLGIERQRLQMWSFAQAVLCTWWCHESKDEETDYSLRLAKIIQSL